MHQSLLRWTSAALVCAAASVHAQGEPPLPANVAGRDLPVNYIDSVKRYQRGLSFKITGGQPAPLNSNQWQVSFGVSWIPDQRQAHFCGGSVVADKWIVTAAHCVRGLLPEDYLVVAGTTVLGSSHQRYAGARVLVHPDYDRVTDENDIALVELRQPLKLSGAVKTIALSSGDAETDLVQGRTLRVTGWGAKEVGGEIVGVLNYIDVPYVSRGTCNEFNSYNGRVTERMICAGAPPKIKNGKIWLDSCQGDSGGPLSAAIGTARPVLVGITSWGDGCGSANKYGVYARVSAFKPWLDACIEGKRECKHQ